MTFKIAEKNFLITGGTGQIGSFLTEKLLENKANVTVIGRNGNDLKEIQDLVDAKIIDSLDDLPPPPPGTVWQVNSGQVSAVPI